MTAIVTDAHYRMSVSLIRDLFDRGVRVAACEKASIEAPVGFASRGAAQCVRLPDEEYEAALLALCREVLEIEGEKPVLFAGGRKDARHGKPEPRCFFRRRGALRRDFFAAGAFQ